MGFGLKIMQVVFTTSVIILHYQPMAFVQNDWHVILERTELQYFNPKFFSNFVLEFRFFNRSTKAYYCQFNLLQNCNNGLEVNVDSYKLYSNEYRGFPITVRLDLCKELQENSFGISDLKRYSNITNCPWKKGFYVLKDFILDETKQPPFIPHGRYKAVHKFLYRSELILEAHIYSEIKGIKKVGNTTVYV